jgi:hypothetical protein
VEVNLERTNILMVELVREPGVRIIEVLGIGDVFLEDGPLRPADLSMVAVMCADYLYVIEMKLVVAVRATSGGS